MALTRTWAHRWVCLGPSLVSGCGCPGCSFLFHHPKSACLSSLLSTTCMKYVFHAREQRWELALPATGARIQPETRKAGNALLLSCLAEKILRPRNSRRQLPKVGNRTSWHRCWTGTCLCSDLLSLHFITFLLSNDI